MQCFLTGYCPSVEYRHQIETFLHSGGTFLHSKLKRLHYSTENTGRSFLLNQLVPYLPRRSLCLVLDSNTILKTESLEWFPAQYRLFSSICHGYDVVLFSSQVSSSPLIRYRFDMIREEQSRLLSLSASPFSSSSFHTLSFFQNEDLGDTIHSKGLYCEVDSHHTPLRSTWIDTVFVSPPHQSPSSFPMTTMSTSCFLCSSSILKRYPFPNSGPFGYDIEEWVHRISSRCIFGQSRMLMVYHQPERTRVSQWKHQTKRVTKYQHGLAPSIDLEWFQYLVLRTNRFWRDVHD